VAGFGGNNTQAVCAAIQEQDFTGLAGILSVSPYYNKPTQEGIYRHYMAIDAVAPVPVIVYNVPGRTGSNISAETTLRLARDGQRIAAVKEASGDLDQITRILANRPHGFLVLSGDDALTLPQLALGIDGVISVVANAWPQRFSGLVRHALAGEFNAARKAHFDLIQAIHWLFAEGNPGGVKAALHAMGLMEETLRLPCFPVGDALREKLTGAVRSLA
jgi:4-hydroxy-tetrahydrodipicolinate synthase